MELKIFRVPINIFEAFTFCEVKYDKLSFAYFKIKAQFFRDFILHYITASNKRC